eukprot:CAMPEP_0178953752 /NCGR_PEP_ID=MMETSP0789-20121207/8594_1 /TAXON_ID=3005 /ORGANISM="Rhizosolenia setigera, Strain CCMP 1694" /LENGTH=248 /DNA_ID=CAMNT_0020635047 /DNA_START=233 /DNA_END=979 /DNA_ORIENTATION=+
MAKSAGTTLNGKLASEFERVCGHKGFSYDAYQFNKRLDDSFGGKKKSYVSASMNTGDAINKLKKNFNRGRVPFDIMYEIGFEQCQYISLETSPKRWDKVTNSLPPSLLPLELHVPCRDPLSHLMSMCNYKKHIFDCDAADFKEEINHCLVAMSRFDKVAFEQNPDIELKCFEATPIEPYIEYMSHRLQSKKTVYPYFKRDTNKPRDKEKECIWQNEEVQNQVITHLRDMESYFAWCEDCLGSKNDLLV